MYFLVCLTSHAGQHVCCASTLLCARTRTAGTCWRSMPRDTCLGLLCLCFCGSTMQPSNEVVRRQHFRQEALGGLLVGLLYHACRFISRCEHWCLIASLHHSSYMVLVLEASDSCCISPSDVGLCFSSDGGRALMVSPAEAH